MPARLGLFVVAPLFVTATAYAQAPGEVTPQPYYEPQPTAPVVTDPCSGGRDVMAHRFAVGLNLGGMSIATEETEEGNETNFRTAELSIRYRATPRFEIELLLSGGRQVLEDDTDGDLAMGAGTLAARYRFRPHRAWNWWLMGGLGATTIERHDSTKDQRDDASRPHLAFGVGLERRFRRLALHAEIRMMAIGPRADSEEMDVAVPPATDDGSQPQPLPPIEPTNDVRRAEELSAGQFTVGASFYF
jgi:hypothetical protein